MEKQSVHLSLVPLCLLLTVAAILTVRPVSASTVEKWLIMPGPVISGHAEVEGECDSCHSVLSDQPQFELCVVCHTGVSEDLTGGVGFHGRIVESDRFECAACHAEHEGRDAVAVVLDEQTFDHGLTDFPLFGAHKNVQCSACHEEGLPNREAQTVCAGCHLEDDPHEGKLGGDCGSCHNAADWADTEFDHNSTAFPLTGAHADQTCEACHRSDDISDVGNTCVACHRDDDVHKGRNGAQCADCHNTSSWKTLTFDHFAISGFALSGGHKGPGCKDCHNAADFRDRSGGECIDCHRTDDIHEGRNGSDCVSCHVTTAWDAVDFDHASRTDFPLPAGHDALACDACHASNVHDDLPRNCTGCHKEDDPHDSQLGERCESCHVPHDWTAELRFDHDITSFPLLGVHADLSCDQCHASARFHDADNYCVACHGSNDPHKGGFGNQCDSCHNPSDWQAWHFDHDLQTDFPLSGAHAGVECDGCHTAGIGRRNAISDDCNSCHRREDPHFGRFGNDCASCHTTSSFSQIEGM